MRDGTIVGGDAAHNDPGGGSTGTRIDGNCGAQNGQGRATGLTDGTIEGAPLVGMTSGAADQAEAEYGVILTAEGEVNAAATHRRRAFR